VSWWISYNEGRLSDRSNPCPNDGMIITIVFGFSCIYFPKSDCGNEYWVFVVSFQDLRILRYEMAGELIFFYEENEQVEKGVALSVAKSIGTQSVSLPSVELHSPRV
jgi:hypothetical protein